MAPAIIILLAALGSAAAFAPAAAPPHALAGVRVQVSVRRGVCMCDKKHADFRCDSIGAPQGTVMARRGAPLRLHMQVNRGDNRDKIFPKGRESIERAKKLDEANKNPNQPSLLMREKKFTWPFPFGFLNTLKEEVG